MNPKLHNCDNLFSGENLSTATLARPRIRKKYITPPINYLFVVQTYHNAVALVIFIDSESTINKHSRAFGI